MNQATTLSPAQAAQVGRTAARVGRLRRELRQELVRLSDAGLHSEAQAATDSLDSLQALHVALVGESE